MKTQLLLATFAATLFMTATESAEANDLRFAIATLKSARQTYTRPAPARQQVSTNVVPQRRVEPAAPKLLLGAYLEAVDGGLRVTETLPGSPASKALQPGDVIRRVSVLGQPTRKLETLLQFDYAKREIGPNRQVALEIVRPGQGTSYAWVTFGLAAELASFTPDAQANARSMFANLNDNYVSQ